MVTWLLYCRQKKSSVLFTIVYRGGARALCWACCSTGPAQFISCKPTLIFRPKAVGLSIILVHLVLAHWFSPGWRDFLAPPLTVLTTILFETSAIRRYWNRWDSGLFLWKIMNWPLNHGRYTLFSNYYLIVQRHFMLPSCHDLAKASHSYCLSS